MRHDPFSGFHIDEMGRIVPMRSVTDYRVSETAKQTIGKILGRKGGFRDPDVRQQFFHELDQRLYWTADRLRFECARPRHSQERDVHLAGIAKAMTDLSDHLDHLHGSTAGLLFSRFSRHLQKMIEDACLGEPLTEPQSARLRILWEEAPKTVLCQGAANANFLGFALKAAAEELGRELAVLPTGKAARSEFLAVERYRREIAVEVALAYVYTFRTVPTTSRVGCFGQILKSVVCDILAKPRFKYDPLRDIQAAKKAPAVLRAIQRSVPGCHTG